jgi:hypothetical protein
MFATPRVERDIEGTHSLRDGRTVRVGNIDWDAREPSIIKALRTVQMGAAPASHWYRVVLRDSHVVDVIAPSLRVVRRQHRTPRIVTLLTIASWGGYLAQECDDFPQCPTRDARSAEESRSSPEPRGLRAERNRARELDREERVAFSATLLDLTATSSDAKLVASADVGGGRLLCRFGALALSRCRVLDSNRPRLLAAPSLPL